MDTQTWDTQTSRKAKAFEAFQHAKMTLQRGLESALHGLRSHASFLQTGMGNQLQLNLDIFILADLSHPETSGVLPPLLAMVGEMLAHEPYGMGHVIACPTLFPEETTPDAQAALYVALQELAGQIAAQDPTPMKNSDKVRAVFSQWNGPVYLFDYRKEGRVEAADRDELCLCVANFLWGVLAHGLTQNLPGARLAQMGEQALPEARFCSGGATVLWLDPHRLLEGCAMLTALKLLEEGKITPKELAVRDIFRPRESVLDADWTWAKKFCKNTPFRLTTGEALDISDSLPLPNFEGIPEAKWVDTLDAWVKAVETETIPSALQQFSENDGALIEEMVENWVNELNALALHALMQSGTFPFLHQAVRRVEEKLADCQKEIIRMGDPTQSAGEAEMEALWQARLELLRECLDPARPKERPTWRGLLRLVWQEAKNPRPARRMLTRWGWVVLAWLRDEQLRRMEMREACVQIRQAYWRRLGLRALETHLLHLLAELSAQLENFEAEVTGLQHTWEEAAGGIASMLNDTRIEASPFRQVALTTPLIQWLFSQQEGKLDIRVQLSSSLGTWLENWRNLTTEELQNTFLDFGRQLFRDEVKNVGLATVLSHQIDDGEASFAVQGKLPLAEILPVLLQGTSPLLRASFDASGGGGEVAACKWVLTPMALQPSVQTLLQPMKADWQVIPVDAPQALSCCHVRAGFPLRGLELLRPLQKAYLSLSASEQEMMWLKAAFERNSYDDQNLVETVF